MTPFTGLSAFPLTPLIDDRVDEGAFARLVGRLTDAGVDSITALGSTGSYAYLDVDERASVARLAVEHAGSTPVHIGVGALRTAHVLRNVEHAERAGAAGVLLAPMSYTQLIWATVAGVLVFADWPDLTTLAGAAVIALGGVLVALPDPWPDRRSRT